MTEQQIMSITHDDLVQLFVLRRDDLKAASKEAVRIARKERYKKDPEFRARRVECSKIWGKANKEYRKEYMRRWRDVNREKLRLSFKKRAIDKRVKVVISKMPEPDEPRRRTDIEAVAYWRQVVDNLENQFIGKQIDIETYYSKRNAAMIQLAAIESRLKCQKKELNNL